MENWLTVEEAAKYLDMGKTSLYTLAKEGSIPANKVGQKWLFSKQDLDAWVRANKPIEEFFLNTDFDIDENPQLREPQIEAYRAIYSYFKLGNTTAIVQIPVGCGKTGLAAIIPFGIAKGRVLVVSPNLTIKEGLFESFDVTNRQKCFWRQRGILKPEQMIGGPFACTLDTGNISVSKKSHIIITNVHQLATNTDKWLNKFPKDFFDLIIVDEAHHSPAKSWGQVIERFSSAKVVNMTATPFRSDKQEISGELVFRYPFKRATFKGYVKQIKASYVAPSEISFTVKGEDRTYNLDEVLKMKEKDWFSRGVALSEVCNQHIVDNSLQKLEELRETGTNHQLIAVACSVDHARTIRSLYSTRGYNADVIYGQMEKDEKENVMRRLRSGELDCIVQVQMLGEGFDHPKLSVAAIFRPFRTLSPYIQFVGRILRVVVQNQPNHPDNYGHVVTHAGMNLDQRLKEFKLFEKDDQQFWENIIGGKEPEVPRDVKSGESRMKNKEPIVANHEIVDSLIEEDFTTADDEDLIRDLEQKLELLGLDPSSAKDLVLKQKKDQTKMVKAAEPFQVLPQREWEELRKRLHEKANRSANMLLNRLELQRNGRKIVNTGIYAANDFTACVTLINQEIKKKHPALRKDWTSEDFKNVTAELDSILNTLTRRYKKILNDN